MQWLLSLHVLGLLDLTFTTPMEVYALPTNSLRRRQLRQKGVSLAHGHAGAVAFSWMVPHQRPTCTVWGYLGPVWAPLMVHCACCALAQVPPWRLLAVPLWAQGLVPLHLGRLGHAACLTDVISSWNSDGSSKGWEHGFHCQTQKPGFRCARFYSH